MDSPLIRQTWIVSGVLITMMGQGTIFSFTSCLIPALKAPDSPIKTDVLTSSWLASCIALSAMAGFILAALTMGTFGRKKVHIVGTIPGIVGYIVIYFSNSISGLMIGRILCGLSNGFCASLGALIIGEFMDPKYRGSFLNLKTTMVAIGSTSVHILGNYLHWRTIAILSTIPFCLGHINTYTWPESPSFLAVQKNFDKCEESFFWLRGKNEQSIRELNDLIMSQKNITNNVKIPCKLKIIEYLKKFTRKDFLMPLFILFLMFAVLECGGRHIFPAYALQIMGQITGNNTQSFYYTLCIDFTAIISSIFSSILVRIFYRRTVFFCSGISSILVLSCICLYLYLVSNGTISGDRTWIPTTMLVVYFLLVGLGCTPIPLAVLGELFPLAHRAAAAGTVGMIMSLWLMITLKVTPPLLETIHVHGTFTVSCIVLILCLSILYFILPETKDKSLPEIEYYFNHGKFRDDDEMDVEVTTEMIAKNNISNQ